MLSFKRLKFNNIGRFVEEQEIDFTKLSNLNQIEGQNSNTGGSSGSGKSTVFNAIDYLLGLNNLSSTVLQSRLTKEPITVDGEFELNGKSLLISRSKKGLSISYDGNVIEGSSKLTEEKLDSLIGISRELFRKMLHKRQKEGGFFLDLTPKETYAFLTESLDMSDLSNKANIVDTDIKNILQELQTVNGSIDKFKAILSELLNTEKSLTEPDQIDEQSAEQKILSLNELISQEQLNISKIESDRKTKEDALLKTRPDTFVPSYDRSHLDSLLAQQASIEKEIKSIYMQKASKESAIKSKISDLLISISTADRAIKDGAEAQRQAISVASDIKKIRASMCPKCEQSWCNETSKLEEASLLDKLASLKTTIQNGKDSEVLKQELQIKMSDLRNELENQKDDGQSLELNKKLSDLKLEIQKEYEKESHHLNIHNQKIKSEMQEFNKKIDELRSVTSMSLNLHSEKISILKEELTKTSMTLQNYKKNMESYLRTKNNINENKAKYISELKELQIKKEALESKAIIAEETKKAIKSYTSRRFDEALSFIGEESTRIIRAIPTMSNATISMEALKETKDGRVKEEVTAVINMDGDTEIPIKSLSGGERTAVDLAIDLAVINMLELKSNKGSDIFILDEPFIGLDTVGIEMALEIIKSSNINKKLIIVDHNPIIAQMVDSKITVVRRGVESRVVQ